MSNESHRENTSESPVRLEITRVKPGTIATFQMLSESYGGIITHWASKRSVACRGPDCSPTIHKSEKIWKGYAAALLWTPKIERWYPTVLEISEGLEMQMRGAYARGQVWRLAREPDNKRRRSAVRGTCLEQRGENETPPEFDILPALIVLYHYPELRLDQQNPLPSNVLVIPSTGPAPRPKADHKPDQRPAQSARSFEQEFRKRLNGVGNPAESRDGR